MKHPELAARFNLDPDRVGWHDTSLWWVRQKRDRAALALDEWESLREQAERIKAYALANLSDLLVEFESRCTENGITVHWAQDGAEHNRIVEGILAERGATHVVKSKSMLTEECGLNDYLEARGVQVVDTDLGERIVQLRNEHPSHIVLPAIHLKKEDVSDTFHAEMGTEKGNTDPDYLVNAARQDLREHFLKAEAGITGVNFAIAESGGVVVCTNEGNADLGTCLPPVHIACMGLEKIIPRLEHLGVFTRLLARSATGQPVTTYTSHFHGPRPGGEMHIVIVDNGRSALLAKEKFRKSLSCIRCGACMNTCPVYRRSGGHSYRFTSPGPIGSVVAPGRDPAKYASLPFASTLCGSCTDVCPVKIDLHDQLLAWRSELVEEGHVPKSQTLPMKLAGVVLARPPLFAVTTKALKFADRVPGFLQPRELRTWLKDRDLPELPRQSFRDWYKENEGGSA